MGMIPLSKAGRMAAPVERITMPIAIVVIVLVLLAVGGISIYNGIVTKRNRCDNAWQTIETQLQRRNDLIPNLVAGFGHFEPKQGFIVEDEAARKAPKVQF